ncbi:SPX domain-containing protein 1-like [Corylus avellana]|uniref:SPX domain-containing protein 1-like n=1 Tax=Corylus avellana TaxID=13451 RepID=UPI001E22D41A|nr:SPX domain-containing protein 1-like [Corylus avellana]
MKFWKILSSLIEETLPEWRDKFLSYKDLKKQLKLIYPKEEEEEHRNKRRRLDPESDGPDCAPSREVVDFVRLLEVEIDKFNAFFVDKEEEYVIRLKELQDKIANAEDSDEDLMQIWRTLADFHGEMVFLLNYSALNYIGLVKILKKYEKRSGALVRLPFIQKVLQEPFYTTDVLNDLVKECQGMLDHLLSNNELASRELAEIRHMESMYMKLTESALRVLKEVRSGSSTVSVFSLPPLQNNAMEWRNLALVEQADE